MVAAAIDDIASQRVKMSYEEYLEPAGNTQLAEWDKGEAIIYYVTDILNRNLYYLE